MTAILDRVDVGSITEQAKQVKFWRTVLTLIAGPQPYSPSAGAWQDLCDRGWLGASSSLARYDRHP